MPNRSLTVVGGALALTAALTLSACGSSSSGGSSSSSSPSSGGSSSAVSGDAAYAQAALDKVTGPVSSFTPPGPAVSGAASLSGKTVYWIPATSAVPLFAAIGGSLTEALTTVGVKVQTCDGKSNPSSIADCLNQAINTKAAAVITGSIPAEFAPTAFKAVTDAGIPLVNTLTIPSGPGAPTKVAYITPAFVGYQALVADSIIAASNANAHVLLFQITDNPAVKIWVDAGALPEYKQHCPQCVVTVQQINTGQLNKLPSIVSAALIKDPQIKYVHSEADSLVQGIATGLQSSPNGSSVQIASMDGVLQVLQAVQAGRGVQSDMGYNLNAFGWYTADQALRLMTGGSAVQNEQFPYARTFNKANTASLSLTPAAQQTGEWYGSTDYQAGFQKLWGKA